MSATLLQMVQQASGEMGLTVPASVAGNTSADVVQALALINAVGYEVQRQYEWEAMTVPYIFQVEVSTITADTTDGASSLTNCSSIVGIDDTYQVSGLGINQATYVTGTPSGSTIALTQPATSSNTTATYVLTKCKYDMPADYDRIIDRTQWDKSKHWMMIGPESAQQWEWLISGYMSSGPRVRWRIFGSQFQIWPALGVDEVLGFEYVSNYWALSTAGAGKTSLTVDTDTCIFPTRLMVLGLKKKYFEIKGFDTTALTRDYEMELSIAKSNDAGAATLSFAPRVSTVLIGWENIPDSNYGS